MPSTSWVDKPMGRDQLACVYAALILADDDISITDEKIKTLLNAANIEVEAIWPSLFARALQGVDVRQLVVGSVGSMTGPSGGATAEGGKAAVAEAATEEKKEEAKKEEPEEDSSDEDMGLGLFD